MTVEELQGHVEKLELHVAHLERQTDEMNSVLFEQSQHLARIQKILSAMNSVIESVEKDRLSHSREKPPHYSA